MIPIDRAAQFIHESNLIEDVTAATLDSIRTDLEDNDNRGHVYAFRYMMGWAKQRVIITEKDLFEIHRLIMLEHLELEGCWRPGEPLDQDIKALIGAWRTTDLPIGSRAGDIPGRMAKLFDCLRHFLVQNAWDLDELVNFAGGLHYEYERIHPFADGNGRTGRLLANYVLAFYGQPIAVFTDADKCQSYYRALSRESGDMMHDYLRLKMFQPETMLSADQWHEWNSRLPEEFRPKPS